MATPRYTIWASDISGRTWTLAQVDDPAQALDRLTIARQASGGFGVFGVYETADPTRPFTEDRLKGKPVPDPEPEPPKVEVPVVQAAPSRPLYTVWGVDRAGNTRTVARLNDPAEVVEVLRMERAAAGRNGVFGVYETEEPERQGVEARIEEELEERKQMSKQMSKDLDVFGYRVTNDGGHLTVERGVVDLTRPGDYGADPLEDGRFRMVPSGDVVDHEERNLRLSPDKPAQPPTDRAEVLEQYRTETTGANRELVDGLSGRRGMRDVYEAVEEYRGAVAPARERRDAALRALKEHGVEGVMAQGEQDKPGGAKEKSMSEGKVFHVRLFNGHNNLANKFGELSPDAQKGLAMKAVEAAYSGVAKVEAKFNPTHEKGACVEIDVTVPWNDSKAADKVFKWEGKTPPEANKAIFREVASGLGIERERGGAIAPAPAEKSLPTPETRPEGAPEQTQATAVAVQPPALTQEQRASLANVMTTSGMSVEGYLEAMREAAQAQGLENDVKALNAALDTYRAHEPAHEQEAAVSR